ncbi:finTRIM family, member 86 isoform X2 [Conger conger]|nr:finTRIM family, member 86 isoform X2 [Conger conger]
MASGAFPGEEFACSVCLEVLRDPATLPCGHTYCLPCIQRHWDQGEAKQEYSCPQCRKTFTPRPVLARSTLLVEAMEQLKLRCGAEGAPPSVSSAPPSLPFPSAPPDGAGLYPQLPAAGRLCPDHQQALELFCPEDREFVCAVCRDHNHRTHRVVPAEVARAERQGDLDLMQVDTQRRIQEREQSLQLLLQSARTHKGAVQALQREAGELFAELARSVELAGSQVQELLGAHEMAEGSRTEGQIHRLEQDLGQLRGRAEELRRLAQMHDHCCFLKNFLTLDTPVPGGEGEVAWADAEAVRFGVRTALRELRDQHHELSKASLARIFRTVNDASAMAQTATTEAPPLPLPCKLGDESNPKHAVNVMAAGNTAHLNPAGGTSNQNPASGTSNQNPTNGTANQSPPTQYPEPKTRDELLKFRFEPTLDPDTAHRHLRLSDGDRKATLRAEAQPYPEHAGRFLFWRQVLCREALGGSPYYWEVEWTGTKVTLGVAHGSMGRKGNDGGSRLGHNERSWGLYWSGAAFSLWHGGRETPLAGPKARRVGVYLDQQAGVLAFYRVSRSQAELLHRVRADFSGPLYPGFRFWSGVGSSVTLCQLD